MIVPWHGLRSRAATAARRVVRRRNGQRFPSPGCPDGLGANDIPRNSFGCHSIPLEVQDQAQFGAPEALMAHAPMSSTAAARSIRGGPQSHLSLYSKHLCPYGQHADEQRERREGGSFFDDGPNHDPFLPNWTERERCSNFVLQSRGRCCPISGVSVLILRISVLIYGGNRVGRR